MLSLRKAARQIRQQNRKSKSQKSGVQGLLYDPDIRVGGQWSIESEFSLTNNKRPLPPILSRELSLTCKFRNCESLSGF